MATQNKKKIISKSPLNASNKNKSNWEFPLNEKNFKLLGIGLALILLGYAVMFFGGKGDEYSLEQGNWNSFTAIGLGPIILVFAYCVFIPYSIIKFFGNSQIDE